MSEWLSRRGRNAGGIIAVGVTTASVDLYHAAAESGVHTLTIGVIVPLCLSLLLVVAGIGLFRSDLATPHTQRVTAWTGAGILIGVGFGYPVIPYQAAHGITMADVPFMLVNWMTTGALGGVLIGYYDGKQQQYRAELEAERSELAARERELTRQNERLDRFASVISHDLRNPLSVATGRLELLATECDSEHIDSLRTAIERMDALIDDVLTLARQGQPIDETEPVSLSEIANSCWDVVDSSDATLAVEHDLTVIADESRLQQLLENLLRNAVEHGSTSSQPQADDSVEHGGDGITVSVGALTDDTGFYVADDGRGITEADAERLFEPGYSTSEDGTGLGLAIVKDIADAHGWEISITESSAGGTRFEIRNVNVA